jgi:hypothetical protein
MIAKVSNHYLDKWKLEKEEETEWRYLLMMFLKYKSN